MPLRDTPASSFKTSRTHLRSLTGVRFLLAAHVILFHFVTVFEGWPQMLRDIIASGYVAVSAFFVLSGFILTYTYVSLESRNPIRFRDFWAARIARVYPLYLLAFLLVVGLYALIPKGQSVPSIFQPPAAVAHVLAAQPWIPDWTLTWNLPAWSVGVEIFFYLVFPFFAWKLLASLKSRSSLLWLVLLMWIAGNAGPLFYAIADPDGLGYLGGARTDGISPEGFWLSAVRFNPLLRLPEFVTGVAIGGLFLLDLREKKQRNGALMTGIAAVVILLTLANSSKLPYVVLHNAALTPVFALLVFGLAHGGRSLDRFLSTRLFVLLGSASYAMYIFQFPVGAPFFAGGVEAITPKTLALYMLLLILVSIFAVKLVERPCRRYLKRILSSSRKTPSHLATSEGSQIRQAFSTPTE